MGCYDPERSVLLGIYLDEQQRQQSENYGNEERTLAGTHAHALPERQVLEHVRAIVGECLPPIGVELVGVSKVFLHPERRHQGCNDVYSKMHRRTQ